MPGVAIKWFVEEPLRPQARSLLVNRHEVIAPDILIAGVAEIARLKAASGEIAAEQAAGIVRNIGLPSFSRAFVESPLLRERAFALALQCGRPVHDCFYVACAETPRRPLVSADEIFLQALQSRRPPACASFRSPACTASPPRDAMDYAELQVTTNYSFLRGGSHPRELVDQAIELGHSAIGIADRNTLAGVVRAYSASRSYEENGHPRTGSSCWSAPGSRRATVTRCSPIRPTSRPTSASRRLLTLGNRRAAKGQCDLSFDDLADHAEDFLAIVLPPRRPDDPAFHDRLRALARPVRRSLLSRRHYAVSRRRCTPPGPARQSRGADEGRRFVATNDVHYHVPERRALQDVRHRHPRSAAPSRSWAFAASPMPSGI